MTKQLIILAMHRSGTSLTANWLARCGLNLGYNLIGATPSNVFGHFEDLDIVEFHEKLLRFNETNLYQGEGPPLKYNDYHVAKAKSLVFLRDQLSDQWGWKQPRACLFLDLWRQVLSNPFYLILFRDPHEVVASLYKREYKKLAYKNSFPQSAGLQFQFEQQQNNITESYLSMWLRHNKELMDHLGHLKEDQYLLVSVSNLVKLHRAIFHHITEQWGFQLTYSDITNIYKPSHMGNDKIEVADQHMLQTAEAMYENLLKLEKKTSIQLGY